MGRGSSDRSWTIKLENSSAHHICWWNLSLPIYIISISIYDHYDHTMIIMIIPFRSLLSHHRKFYYIMISNTPGLFNNIWIMMNIHHRFDSNLDSMARGDAPVTKVPIAGPRLWWGVGSLRGSHGMKPWDEAMGIFTDDLMADFKTGPNGISGDLLIINWRLLGRSPKASPVNISPLSVSSLTWFEFSFAAHLKVPPTPLKYSFFLILFKLHRACFVVLLVSSWIMPCTHGL